MSRARTCPSILNCQRLQEMPGTELHSVPAQVSGDRTERVTPVPIPNTEVKPLRADGTARATLWETRSLPGLKSSEEPQGSSELFAFYIHSSDRITSHCKLAVPKFRSRLKAFVTH